MTPWWADLAPVTLPVPCGRELHEVRWADGALTTPAHPDAERERALTALGGDPSACLQLADVWHRHADDIDVLLFASRGPADPLDHERLGAGWELAGGVHPHGWYSPMPAAYSAYSSMLSVRSPARGWAAYSPLTNHFDDDEMEPAGVASLLSLGSGLPQRLVATVIATWAARIDAADERVAAALPALDAAVYGRLRATLLPWLGRSERVDFTLLPAGGAAALRRDGDAVVAALPFTWLRDVWANGLSVFLDRFCIDVERTAGRTRTLTTLTRDLSTRERLTISG